MRVLSSAALCCIVLSLSHQAAAFPIAGCGALDPIVRLSTLEDPAGTDQVNSIDNSCVAVGWADDYDGNSFAAIWTGTDVFQDPAGVMTEFPIFLDDPYEVRNDNTTALDIDGPLILVSSGCGYFTVFDMATNTWSAPMTSYASWMHTPQLTNSSGWTVEYGPDWAGYENAYLVDTPEPGSGVLCSMGAAALLLVGFLTAPPRLRRRRA